MHAPNAKQDAIPISSLNDRPDAAQQRNRYFWHEKHAVSFNKPVHSRQQTDPGFQLTTAHALTGGGRRNSSQATQHASL